MPLSSHFINQKDLDSVTSSATDSLCDPGQVTSPCLSFPRVKSELTWGYGGVVH